MHGIFMIITFLWSIIAGVLKYRVIVPARDFLSASSCSRLLHPVLDCNPGRYIRDRQVKGNEVYK